MLGLVLAVVLGVSACWEDPEAGLGDDVEVSEASSEEVQAELVEPPASCLLMRDWETYPIGDRRCRAYSYDDGGRVVLHTFDPDCDGDFDVDGGGSTGYCDRHTYDVQGRPLSKTHDRGCSGEGLSMCRTWSYDDAALVVVETEDSACSGSPEFVWTRRYDGAGNLVSDRVDSNADGVSETYCKDFTYDANGMVLEKSSDEGCDGSVEWCVRATFDDDGDPMTEHHDDDCDGVPDRNCRSYTFATLANGDVESEQRLESTCDGDATCWLVRSDADGVELSSQRDDGCDGTVEYCREHVFGANGSLVGISISEPCGVATTVCAEATTIDDDGLLVSSQDDPECDGHARNCLSYAYDEAGQLIETTHDASCSGFELGCSTYSYDAYGNLVTTHSASPCGDDYFQEKHFEYACDP